MNNVALKLLLKTKDQLQKLTSEFEDSIKLSENAINLLLKSLENLKAIVLKNNFKNQSEEIKFFKEIKPLFFSKLIYQTKVLKIETKSLHLKVNCNHH